MIRLVRILGVILMAAGAIVILTWLIEPLREVLGKSLLERAGLRRRHM